MSENQQPVTTPPPEPMPVDGPVQPSTPSAQPVVTVGGHASGPVSVPQTLTAVEPPQTRHWYSFIYRVFRGTPKRYAELLALFIVSPLLIIVTYGVALLVLTMFGDGGAGFVLVWGLMPLFWVVLIGWYVLYFSVLARSVVLFVQSIARHTIAPTARATMLYVIVAALLIVPFLIPAQTGAANTVERETMTAYVPSKSISDANPKTKSVTAIRPTMDASIERTTVPRTYSVDSASGEEPWGDGDTIRYQDFGNFEVYELYQVGPVLKTYVTNGDKDYLVSNQLELLQAPYMGTTPKGTKVRALAIPACGSTSVASYAYAAELKHGVKVLIELENRVPGQPFCTQYRTRSTSVLPPPEMLSIDRVYAYIDSIQPYTIAFGTTDRTPASNTLLSADSPVEQVLFRPINHAANAVEALSGN